jgi:hypothetical protein
MAAFRAIEKPALALSGLQVTGVVQSAGFAGRWSSTDWMEANNIKYLFHSSQNWSWQQAHQFASRAWDRIGLD